MFTVKASSAFFVFTDISRLQELMQEQPMVIDFDFGLRQLNGNRSLLYRLLRKFAAEYQSLGTRLQTMLAQQDITEAENLVHTLKPKQSAHLTWFSQ